MPSGDAQRAWFPEMLAELEAFWTPDVSWDALIAFCTRMTAVRSEIRTTRGIRSPMMYCPSCKQRHRSRLPDISPRSALFALQKLEMISDDQMKTLDRDWAKYRKEKQLDAYGNPKTTEPSASTGCESNETNDSDIERTIPRNTKRIVTIRCTGAAKSGGFTVDNQSSPTRDRWRWLPRQQAC